MTTAANSPTTPPLPDDPALCHEIISQLQATLAESQRLNEQLQYRLEALLRRIYGPKSERFDPAQLVLFAQLLAAAAGEPASADPEAEPDKPKPGSKPGHGRRLPPKDLPRQRVEHPVRPQDVPCPCCGTDRVRMGEEVSEQLEYVPASLFVLEHVRAKLVCRACEEIVVADPPAKPVDKGLPGPGLIAHIVTSKYSEHLPLNRLEAVFARHGVDLSRQTMCGWMAKAAELLGPVVRRMAELVRQSAVVWTDDTTVPVRDPKLNKTRTGRLWVYIGDREHPYLVFDYTPTRARDGPAAWLGPWRGYLQADAYAGYDALFAGGGVVEVACWAHARRRFHDARDSDPQRSHLALAFITRLYAVEREAKDLPDEDRRRLRGEKSVPLLADLFGWMESEQRQVLPKSPISEALGYALNHRAALTRYCENGRLSIDNNVSERALRRVAIGRRNWLFAGSDAGGRTAAVLYTLVATCREHGLDPFLYLRDVLLRIVTHPASRLDELLPDNWKAALLKSLDAPAPPSAAAQPTVS